MRPFFPYYGSMWNRARYYPSEPTMPDLKERLRAMYSHRGDGIPTQPVNPDGDEAADRIAALEDALQWAADNADNQDMNHVNYRIGIGSRARAVLKGDA